ncbi:hypothetical protein VTN77DRAFT_3788 [Rasamsonia byssochlamydoides]|uniref:uncharacterized protein n=1 Tax=Rasamsonia byssochlamydoides TaxID=89139 RepID=UPI003742F81B
MLYREQRQAAAKETKALTAGIIQTTRGGSTESTFYTTLALPLLPSSSNGSKKKTRVYVENGDSLTIAQRLLSTSPAAKIGVLNMASERRPGGGWMRGSLAQEEALCLRSTLAVTLKPSYYPLPPLGAIWSPGVVVFRDEVVNDCRVFEPVERFVVSVVSVAGLRRPRLSEDEQDYRLLQDVETMENKIRQMLRIMATNQITHCVLGALGCGVFGNPPKRVAGLFRQVILEEEFAGYFDEIVFAVLDPKGEGNLRIFQEVVGDFVIE